MICLLYTSDAADEGLGVDLGGRRIIKKSLRQFQVIIELHLGFVPDKNFCIEALRTHLV